MEENQLIKELSVPIFQAKGWLKFIGVLFIIYGIISVITIVGIIWCWIPLWMGILLFQSGKNIETAYLNESKSNLLISLQKLKTYFVVTGVITLISIIVVIIAAIASGGAIFSLMDILGSI